MIGRKPDSAPVSTTVASSIAGRAVLASGSLVFDQAEYVALQFSAGAAGTMKIEISLESRPDEDTKPEHQLVSDGHLRLNLVNFDDPNGMGWSKPLPLRLGDRRVGFSFFIYSIGGGRLIHYTLTALD